MRVAFLSANREKLPDPVVPLGLLYIHGATPSHHERVFWDLCFEADPLRALASWVRRFDPELVALGMRNLQNCDYTDYSSTVAYYRSVVDTVRAHTKCPIVVGGGGFSVMPAKLMEALGVDYGIEGEGEIAFPRLLRALEAGDRTALSSIHGLHYYEGGGLVSNPRASEFLDLDALAVPDRTLVDDRYYEQIGIDSIQTKRGCALRCDYCTYPLIEGRAIRKRSPAAVVDEIEQRLAEHPAVNHFFVVDSVFNIPPKHAKAICQEIIDRRLDVRWTCYANPIGFDGELASLLRKSGCVGMEIGSDSGCDDVLLRLRKGFDTAKVRAIHDLSESVGLRDCHSFLIGTPGETLDHVRRTLDFIVDLDPFAAILMAYKDDEEALDPEYEAHRQRFRDEIKQLLEEHQSAFPRWIIPALSANFDVRFFKVLRKHGLRGPLWQHLMLIDGDDRGDRRKPIDTATPPTKPGLPVV